MKNKVRQKEKRFYSTKIMTFFLILFPLTLQASQKVSQEEIASLWRLTSQKGCASGQNRKNMSLETERKGFGTAGLTSPDETDPHFSTAADYSCCVELCHTLERRKGHQKQWSIKINWICGNKLHKHGDGPQNQVWLIDCEMSLKQLCSTLVFRRYLISLNCYHSISAILDTLTFS